jgi:hypothetical protein
MGGAARAAVLASIAAMLLGPGPRAAAATAEPAPQAAPARERTLDQDLDAARDAMKAGKWAAAAEGILKAVTSREGSDEVRRRLPEIEEELQQALFRSKFKPLTPQELFGMYAKSFSETTKKLVLEYANGPKAPDWEHEGEGIHVLGIRWAQQVTLEVDCRPADTAGRRGNLCFLSYDPEKKTGYMCVPGVSWVKGNSLISSDTKIAKLGGRGAGELTTRQEDLSTISGPVYRIRYARRDGEIEMSAKWIRSDEQGKFGGIPTTVALDSEFKNGLVALRAIEGSNLIVTGTVDDLAAKAAVARAHDERFREWKERQYDRVKVLPRWALEKAAQVVAERPYDLPPDATEPAGPALQLVIAAWHDNDRAAIVKGAANLRVPSEGTALFLKGLMLNALHSPAAAHRELSSLVERFPEFGPGWIARAEASLARRDLDAARADLDRAAPSVAAYPRYHELRAELGIASNDLPAVRAATDAARSAGVRSEMLEFLGGWVVRAIRGPAWAKRYDFAGENAVVASDHSQVLARDTALLVSETMADCRRHFGWKRPGAPPVKTFVFATREGFLAYAGETGRDLEHAAGAYMPSTREMVLFVPDVARASFWRTVRHETVHAFLDEFVADPPTWVNEGLAQWFERGGPRTETAEVDGIEEASLRAAYDAAQRGQQTKLAALMVMDHAEFMEGAGFRYPESLLLVTFLLQDKAHRPTFQAYIEAVRGGASAKEAYEAHFAPGIAAIEREFRNWVYHRYPREWRR